ERFQVIAECLHVGRREARVLMREAAVDLRGELEVAVRGHAARPALRVTRRRDPVERRVDLDRIEVLREVREGVEARSVLRIDDPFPVFVAPTGGTDTNGVAN